MLLVLFIRFDIAISTTTPHANPQRVSHLFSLHAIKSQFTRFSRVIDDLGCARNVSETRQSRGETRNPTRERISLSSRGFTVPSGFGCRRISPVLSLFLFRSPCLPLRALRPEATRRMLFAVQRSENELSPGRGSYRGNIGKLPPPRGRLSPIVAFIHFWRGNSCALVCMCGRQ